MNIKTIWIDLDNSPHVLIFRPIISELQKRGSTVIVTARDFAQTIQLLEFYGLPFEKIGRHGGKYKSLKVLNLLIRSIQLYFHIRKRSIDLAISHGSRTQLLVASLLRIPSVLMLDYEYTESRIFNFFATLILMPAVIPDERLKSAGFNLRKVIRYNGLKEELYLRDFIPTLNIRSSLGVSTDKILVVLRPPGIVGNYHDNRSEILTVRLIHHLLLNNHVEIIVVARTKEDKSLIENYFGKKVRFLSRTIDGPQLIWAADIFISGGGTMNREAALLGIPAFSVFTGKRPYVDEYLVSQHKLIFIDSVENIKNIPIVKRNKYEHKINFRNLAPEIIDIINIHYISLKKQTP